MPRHLPCDRKRGHNLPSRRGSVIVLAAVLMTVVFCFAAFAIDIGYISLTRSQLQNASDAASLGGGMNLMEGLGPQASSATIVEATARQTAVYVAAQNEAADVSAVYLNSSSDVEFGNRTWDAGMGTWTENWGATPYNLIRTTARRNSASSTNGDKRLTLCFAPLIGNSTASLLATSTATISPGGGFRVPPGSGQTAPVMPIALDYTSWLLYGLGSGEDEYTVDPETGAVTPGSDGIKELDLYPNSNGMLTSGNRGTVDFGSEDNSTADLSRQIRNGLSEEDLSYFPNGTLTADNGAIQVNGDTGLSGGIKDDLEAIIGEPRAIPLFTTVNHPGNNATYTITHFVGIRLVHVNMTGNTKRVLIQPATVSGDAVVAGTGSSQSTYIYSRPRLIH